MDYLSKAIRRLRPNAQFVYSEEDYSTIKWDVLEGSAPTQVEIDSTIEAIKQEEAQAATESAAKRQALLARLGITEDEAKLLLS